MDANIIMALISVLTGGSLMSLLTFFAANREKKREQKTQETDDRIKAWKEISEKKETDIDRLNIQLKNRDKYISGLGRHITKLEQIVMKLDPGFELPSRPEN